MKVHVSIVTLLLLFLPACSYETDEIYFKEIPPPQHEITFTLDKYNEDDVIYLSRPETFSFEIGITPGKIERVQLMLNDEVLLTTLGGKISYPFDDDLIKPGVYEMTIEVIALPGTGSLAEETGFEKLHLSRSWTVQIDI